MGGGCTKEKHFSTHPHSPSWIPAYLASVTKVSSGSRYILAGGPRFRWRALILSAKGKWTFLPFIHHDGDGICPPRFSTCARTTLHSPLPPINTPLFSSIVRAEYRPRTRSIRVSFPPHCPTFPSSGRHRGRAHFESCTPLVELKQAEIIGRRIKKRILKHSIRYSRYSWV